MVSGIGEVLENLFLNMVQNPIAAIVNGQYIGILMWAVIFGLALSFGLCKLLGTGFVLNVGAIILGVGFSAAVGIIFGWAPARKASRLNPIDALRAA